MKQWIDKLRQERTLTPEEFRQLLTGCDAEILRYINKQAQEVALLHFGNKIYIRGLIEISNCCRNNCYYCGIRKGNPNIERYRLSRESILDCCRQGYELGFRTFVLQGGEDPALTDDRIEMTVARIRQDYPDCAITLSLGENHVRHTNVSSVPEPTVICYVTKLIMSCITGNCIQRKCPANDACNV